MYCMYSTPRIPYMYGKVQWVHGLGPRVQGLGFRLATSEGNGGYACVNGASQGMVPDKYSWDVYVYGWHILVYDCTLYECTICTVPGAAPPDPC